MTIKQSTCDDKVFFLGGYEEHDDARIETDLIDQGFTDNVWEVIERREATAPDTNTDYDLTAFSQLLGEYGSVEFVRVQAER